MWAVLALRSPSRAQPFACTEGDAGCAPVASTTCTTPLCTVCESNLSDAGVPFGTDGGLYTPPVCVPSTCTGLCETGATTCAPTLALMAPRDLTPAWSVSRSPTGSCTYDVCGRATSLAAGTSSPCLSDVGSTLAERFLRGDCDADGLPNAIEWRSDTRNFACTAEVPILTVDRATASGLTASSTTRCIDANTDCGPGRECVDSLCVDPQRLSIEICEPPTSSIGASARLCADRSTICVPAPRAFRVSGTRASVRGMCLPFEAFSIAGCFEQYLLACGSLEARSAYEFLALGDCDSDGVNNHDDRSGLTGTIEPLACTPSAYVWGRRESGGPLVMEQARLADRSGGVATCGTALSAVYITDLSMDAALCVPAGAEVVALAGPMPGRTIPCARATTPGADAGAVAASNLCAVRATPALLTCALEALDAGHADACFEEGASYLDVALARGDCDGDGVANADDVAPCDGLGDAGLADSDAAVDGAIDMDGALSDADAAVPPTITGSTCVCRATSAPTRRGELAALVALALVVVRRRVLSRGSL